MLGVERKRDLPESLSFLLLSGVSWRSLCIANVTSAAAWKSSADPTDRPLRQRGERGGDHFSPFSTTPMKTGEIASSMRLHKELGVAAMRLLLALSLSTGYNDAVDCTSRRSRGRLPNRGFFSSSCVREL